MERRPAIFVDRDGVINENRSDHVKDWSEFHFLPGALEALETLANLPVSIVGVTNQAIVRRGIVEETKIQEIHRRMLSRITASGGRIDRMYYCPHRADERCNCRKPAPGMLLTAAHDLQLDLTSSILIGDAVTDIEAGKRVGCKTILVLSGRGQSALEQINGHSYPTPDAIANDLRHSIPIVLSLLGGHLAIPNSNVA